MPLVARTTPHGGLRAEGGRQIKETGRCRAFSGRCQDGGHLLDDSVSRTFEGSRRSGRVVARASIAVGVCVLWLFIDAAGDNGLCGESNIRTQSFAASSETVPKVAQPECGSAEVLARALREELDALRSATEAARIKQKQALDQERDRADALARELSSLWVEFDTTRIAGSETMQTGEAEVKQRQAPDRDRDRAEALARELTSLRAELERSRKERDRTETLASELESARKEAEERSARLAAAQAEMLQATETNRAIAAQQKLDLASERDRADALARELISVRSELEASNRQIALLWTERSTPATAASRSPANEQRSRARANASLRHADANSVRPLLERAIERGSARAVPTPATRKKH
jgi:hypothetical protein